MGLTGNDGHTVGADSSLGKEKQSISLITNPKVTGLSDQRNISIRLVGLPGECKEWPWALFLVQRHL